MEKETKKSKLKIIIPVIIAIVVIAIAIVGVVIPKNKKSEEKISKEENKQITYKEYSTLGLSFELPQEWKIKEDDDELSAQLDSELSSFSVFSQDVPSSQFTYFAETYMPNMIKQLGYTRTKTYTKNTYSSYNAYDYEAETIIQGKTVPVKITVIDSNKGVVVFLLTYGDSLYDYLDVYNHILNSIK